LAAHLLREIRQPIEIPVLPASIALNDNDKQHKELQPLVHNLSVPQVNNHNDLLHNGLKEARVNPCNSHPNPSPLDVPVMLKNLSRTKDQAE
jgi:hypothetical protein